MYTRENVLADDQGNLKDSASGVGILFSRIFSERILAQGAIGSRIVWVRIQGPVCAILIVCVYVPHKFHKEKPYASDTLTQLDKLLADYKIINEETVSSLWGILIVKSNGTFTA